MKSIVVMRGLNSTYIYIYAFSRRFYPKRLTVLSGYSFLISICVPWESNPQPFALLTQCSTTEPQEHRFLLELNLPVFPCMRLNSVRNQTHVILYQSLVKIQYYADGKAWSEGDPTGKLWNCIEARRAVIWHDCRALSKACEWQCDIGQLSLLIARQWERLAPLKSMLCCRRGFVFYVKANNLKRCSTRCLDLHCLCGV